MRILLVEDDPVSSLVIARLIRHLGHDVVAVNGSAEALEILERQSIDAVVSDWVMAGMDGLELCRAIRARQNESYTYFILITARTGHDERDFAFHHGVDDILDKPIDFSALAVRLTVAERILQMQSTLQQRGQELSTISTLLQRQRERVSNLFKGLPIPCITVDSDGLIMEWNSAAERLFEKMAFEVWMKPMADVMTMPRQRQFARRIIQQSLAGEVISQFDWRYPLADARRLRLVMSAFPIHGPDDRQVGSVFAFVNITRQEELAQRVREQLKVQRELSARLELLATTDGLTGLHNNRTFKARLTEEIASARRTGQPLSLVLADVDKFKAVNDDFGHLAGDEVLRKVAASFRSIMNRSDNVLAARYGGEEFVLLAPGYDPARALELAEDARLHIQNETWPLRPVTVSLGVSTFSPEMADPDIFIEQADQALYYCKLNGRNCSHHFSDIPPEALENVA